MKYCDLINKQLCEAYPDRIDLDRGEIRKVLKTTWHVTCELAKQMPRGTKRGRFALFHDKVTAPQPAESPVAAEMAVQNIDAFDEIVVPTKDRSYVEWGHHSDIKSIIESGDFFPLYIAGPSGNGKTLMVQQACAQAKRKILRVQISPETDEDDLIGGFRLKNGETVFSKGPVIRAMQEGAILLLDEIDRGSNKIMCLQGVLEGGSVLIKKTGEVVNPAPGFNVIATANTRGRGDDETGHYTATTIIDDAFLERFYINLNQPFPDASVERHIILRHAKDPGNDDTKQFAVFLTGTAEAIRKTFESGGVDDVLSTRRLCHIIRACDIFKGDRLKAITLCINKFDQTFREAVIELYRKIDPSIEKSD